jgi:hypothetical protein
MNCDQVFQHLTSVHPAPVNGQLDRHLAGCPSCRELAELFWPAVAAFDGGPNEDDSGDAPGSWERVWDAVSVAERTAAQLKDARPATDRRTRAWPFAACAAVLAVGTFLGASLDRAGWLGSAGSNRADSPGSTAVKAPSDEVFRCARLVSHARHAGDDGACPVCQSRGAKFKLVTLCMTCHDDADDTSSDVRFHDLQSSLRSGRRSLRTTSPEPIVPASSPTVRILWPSVRPLECGDLSPLSFSIAADTRTTRHVTELTVRGDCCVQTFTSATRRADPKEKESGDKSPHSKGILVAV